MEMKPSPLFEPVLWQQDGFKILDETRLPSRIEYIEVRALPQALAAVKDMKTRAFGQVLTFFYAAALVARGENSPDALRARISRLGEEFAAVRPTFDFNGLARYFEPWFDESPQGDAGAWFDGKLRVFIGRIIGCRLNRARRAAELLPARCRLLTHCNVSGELVAIADQCGKLGKELSVVATETRPYLQGSRLTAWELNEAGVEVEVIPDGAIAQVIAAGGIDAVIVGADRVALNGDIVNKVGTYPIAVTAERYGIPFYALVQDPGALQSGADVVIEERPAAELFQLEGESLLDAPLEGRYPAFDVTPARLIARLIGLERNSTPEEFRQKYQPKDASTIGEKAADHLLVHGLPKRAEYASVARSLKLENPAHVLVAEMRPGLSGLHTTRELRERNVPAEIISDNMMGTFFAQGAIRRLYLFYTDVGMEGPVASPGALLAALLARAHGVPIELLAGDAPAPALDGDVSTFLGRRVLAEGAKVFRLQSEVIPWSLFKENSGA
jgi:methylthioribose-1-phosphate isomerase